MKISDIINAIEEVAPLSLQESYDNSGVQVGDVNNEATGALLCIDITEDVVEEAIQESINLIISHHPLIFKPIKSITGANYIERAIIKAIQHNITIYSAHTNLDNAFGGVNYKISEKIGLTNVNILSPAKDKLLKLVTYSPTQSALAIRNALFSAGAGSIGEYDMCSFNQQGVGTFRGSEATNPFCGEKGELHNENEVKIEVVLPVYKQGSVVKALLAAHPYEEPVYDIYALQNRWNRAGAGVYGELLSPISEIDFLAMVKGVFHTKVIKHTNLLGKKISKVAVCGGSGASLIEQAQAVGADAYITGEIGYHNFFSTEDRILLVEAGHYETEEYTKDIFCDIITKKFPNFVPQYTKVGNNPINYL